MNLTKVVAIATDRLTRAGYSEKEWFDILLGFVQDEMGLKIHGWQDLNDQGLTLLEVVGRVQADKKNFYIWFYINHIIQPVIEKMGD